VTGSPGETQPERTALAWQRTGLGVLAVGGLLAHGALTAHRVALVGLACAVALFGLAILGVLAPLRYRQVRRTVHAGGAVPARRPAAAVSAIVLFTAASGVVAGVLLLLG
jgi:putative membrane protein